MALNLMFMKLKNMCIEVFTIHRFFDKLIYQNKNNNCNRCKKTALSYNYHYSCYYSIMSITLSALLLLSLLSIPTVVNANALMSNVARAEEQHQQITESSLQANRGSSNNTIIPTAQ